MLPLLFHSIPNPTDHNTTHVSTPQTTATATTSIATPQAALNVLQGANAVNGGTPSPFVAQVQASPVGQGLAPQQLEVAYASVHGAAACNTCGFEGDVAGQFVGDGACVRWVGTVIVGLV